MEEKKTEIKDYLRTVVTPFLTPLMEEMVKERPTNLAEYTQGYIAKLIRNYSSYLEKQKEQETESDSENSLDDEDREEIDKKFQMKLQENKKKNRNSRQGISAEVYGQFNKRESFIPTVVEKDQKTIGSIT